MEKNSFFFHQLNNGKNKRELGRCKEDTPAASRIQKGTKHLFKNSIFILSEIIILTGNRVKFNRCNNSKKLLFECNLQFSQHISYYFLIVLSELLIRVITMT